MALFVFVTCHVYIFTVYQKFHIALVHVDVDMMLL